MSESPSFDAILARLNYVQRELERHATAIAVLDGERAELEIAVRVFRRFESDDSAPAQSMPTPDQPQLQDHPSLAEPGGPAKRTLRRTLKPGRKMRLVTYAKPTGTPTVIEMIKMALDGSAPMEPKAILEIVRDRWWPDAPSSSIGPTAWRMWNEMGILAKSEDGLYSFPKEKTPAGEAAGVSEPSPASTRLFVNPSQ